MFEKCLSSSFLRGTVSAPARKIFVGHSRADDLYNIYHRTGLSLAIALVPTISEASGRRVGCACIKTRMDIEKAEKSVMGEGQGC